MQREEVNNVTKSEIRDYVRSATNGRRAGNKGRGFVTREMQEKSVSKHTQREPLRRTNEGRVHILRRKTA